MFAIDPYYGSFTINSFHKNPVWGWGLGFKFQGCASVEGRGFGMLGSSDLELEGFRVPGFRVLGVWSFRVLDCRVLGFRALGV